MLQICNTLPSHRSHIWLCVIYLRFLDDCLWEKETNLHVRYFCSDWNQCFIMRRQHFNIYTSVLISQDVIYIFNACDDSYVYRMHKYFPKNQSTWYRNAYIWHTKESSTIGTALVGAHQPPANHTQTPSSKRTESAFESAICYDLILDID